MELLSNRQYEECRKQLEWCRLRRPDDEAVNTAIAEVMVALVKKKEANREQQEQ